MTKGFTQKIRSGWNEYGTYRAAVVGDRDRHVEGRWQHAGAAVQEINRSGIDWSVLIVDTLPMVKFGICRRVDL